MNDSLHLPVVEKVMCYIVQRGCVLTFVHTDFPEAGLQVPAGTIRQGETPEAAALREAREETGLQKLEIIAKLGVSKFDARSIGKREWHERHFFHMKTADNTPPQWSHAERHGPGSEPIRFTFSWLPLDLAANRLAASQGALLYTLYSGQP